MGNKKKLLLIEKMIYFKKTRIIKVNDIYKVSSFQIHKKGRYGMTEYNQSWFENIRLQRFNQWNLAKKKLKMGQIFGYLLNTIRPGIEKMCFFNWEYLSYYRSLWNFLICFLFVSQFYVDRAYQPIF